MTTYSLGDFLIQVKNASMAKNKELTVSANKQIVAMAGCLKKLGYLDEVKKDGKNLKLTLAFRYKRPVLMNLKLVSKPGLRIYAKADEIVEKKGPSIFVISTPKGILSSKEAIKARLGGEVIAELT